MLAACIADYCWGKIPNWLIGVGILLGTGKGIEREGMAGILYFAAGGFLPFLAAYPLYRLGMLGAGDVKLLFVGAGCMPAAEAVKWIGVTFLAAGLNAAVKMLWCGNGKERIRYFLSYMSDVICTGRWKPYFDTPAEEKDKRLHVCMAGPMLCSMLMYWGGLY